MNNILRPELIWIEGRCYRVSDSTTEVSNFEEHDMYENEINYSDAHVEDEDDDFEVAMIDNSRYSTNFHISKHYLGSIIGKKGATKMRVERDTRTNIKIPRQGESGDIYILGPSASNVRTARRRINMIVMSSRMKQKATHFNCIPMNSPEIIKNFEIFKERVLNECPSRGLEESIFIRAEKLHLTLGIMCLMDNEERLEASKLLAEAKETVIMPLLSEYMPLKIRLKGLSYMNDDPSQIHVLYGKVSEEGLPGSGLLQTLGDSLIKHFYKAGYGNSWHQKESIKLHVTLINSSYRENDDQPSAGDAGKSAPRVSFDGSDILKKFEDFDFGVAELKEIHLSQMHTLGEDGFYQPTCVIYFNT